MSWWDGRIFALDLETTSPEPEEARIVSACVVIVGESRADEGLGRGVEEWTAIADPGVEIPAEAAEIHGITTERARAEGQPVADVVAQMCAELDKRQPGEPLVIVNARYDLTVADRELRRLGDEGIPAEFAMQIIDPLEIDHHLDRYRPGSRKLIDTCETYGVSLGHAHDAAFDAIAGARLAWLLGKHGKVVRRVRNAGERQEFIALTQEWQAAREDLDALHRLQQRVAGERAARLEEYFHRGNPRKDVPPQPDRMVPRDWPFIPITRVS